MQMPPLPKRWPSYSGVGLDDLQKSLQTQQFCNSPLMLITHPSTPHIILFLTRTELLIINAYATTRDNQHRNKELLRETTSLASMTITLNSHLCFFPQP